MGEAEREEAEAKVRRKRRRVKGSGKGSVQFSGNDEGRKGNRISGGNSEREPPVPIPNTEVKPLSAEGTWLDTAREKDVYKRQAGDNSEEGGDDVKSSCPL